MKLTTPLEQIKGVGPKTAQALAAAGLTTVSDALNFLPRAYDDYSTAVNVADLQSGKVTVKARCESVSTRIVRRGLRITTAVLADKSGKVKAVWFNQPYRETQLKSDAEFIFSGQFGMQYNRYQINNPSVELAKEIAKTSFGTSHKDTREKCLDVIENKVKEKYGQEKVERAYTSGIIRRIIEKKEGIHIYDQKEGLEALKNKGYNEIITMSLHILGGIEYSKLDDSYGKVTEPLLKAEEDYLKIVNNEEFNNLEGNDAIVFMGHGTESAADSTYQKLQEEYIKAGKNNIFVATVEGEVTIEDIIEKLKKTDYKKILLKPFMIVAGDHAKNDMASDEEDSWKTVLTNEGYEVIALLKGMGEYEFIQDMFMDKLEKVYKNKN